MRRSITTVIALVAALGGAACEDGPSQTFSPAPPGAGTVWNGTPGGGGIPADSGIFVSPATQSFDAQVGGQNANQLCTAMQEKNVWTANFTAPIVPPGLAGGIDIAGGPLNSNGVWGYDPQCLNYTTCNPNKLASPSDYGTYNPVSESWAGTTVEQAQTLLCQVTPSGTPFAVTNGAAWGESQELSIFYNTNSRIITDLIIGYGYNGEIIGVNKTATPPVTYTVNMNNQPMTSQAEGGQVQQITLDWTDPTGLNKITNGLYEALRQTFTPDFPADTDCVSAGHCIIDNNGTDDGILFFTPLNLAIFVLSTVGTTAAGSNPFLIDLGVLKVLPFSGAAVTMKLDLAGEGPVVLANGLGDTSDPQTCKYSLGMKYGDPNTAGTFDHDCVQVFHGNTSTSATNNQIAQAKLLGALAHGDENYQFDIEGVDPQFTATLSPTTVVADGQDPNPQDVAWQLTIDQFVLGPIANDYVNNTYTPGQQDWHGIGLVTLEWANLVQQYMTANAGVNTQLGDPACIAQFGAALTGAAGGGTDAGTADAGTTDAAAADAGGGSGAKVCSGLEGVVTTAPYSVVPASMAVNALGAAGATVNTGNPNCDATDAMAGNCPLNGIAVGMKPNTWYAYFCGDGKGLNPPNSATGVPVGYVNCIGGSTSTNAYTGFYFDTMQEAVAIGRYGHVPNGTGGAAIPETLASRRFYFKEWILAVVKYMQTADTVTTPLVGAVGTTAIDNNVVDPNEIFFDTLGGGFEFGEYVDRLSVNSGSTNGVPGQAPTALEIGTNLLTSVINNFSFDRYNFRGESALYTALKDNSSDKPGAEPLFITNVVGIPAAELVFGTGSAGYGSAIANTAIDPTTGQSILQPYADAFGTSVLGIAAYGAAPVDSGLTIDSTTYELIQSAMVTVPVLADPFGYTGTAPTGLAPCANPAVGPCAYSTLLPFLQGGSVGFPVTIDGSRDKFYNTLNVDFTGTTVNGSVDYEYVATTTADGGIGKPSLVIRAIETQNYLGQVFVCVENGLAGGVDFLGVRMYDNGVDILNWITAHTVGGTNPVADCGIQIKYSIYGNYPDYITFGVNPAYPLHGVRLGLNPGFGGSVITDVTIFDPNVVSTLGQ